MTESILTVRGYFMRHFALCQTCNSQKDAWEKLEDELEQLQKEYNIPAKPRYSSYESFRTKKTQYYQRNRD